MRLRTALPFALALLGALAPTLVFGQVEVTANAGTPGPTTYATLQSAFAAVNSGIHQGDVVIEITADVTESATAVLHASGSGSALYDSLAVIPSGGAPRTISGAMADGAPLIDLDGADFVAIDGLDVNGNALTLSNSNSSAVAGTSTIRFTGDATDNLVTHVTVLGASTASGAVGAGTILFATGLATGNDGNSVSHCRLGPVGANLPSRAVVSFGSTASTTLYNSGVELLDNQIYDYWHASAASTAVYLGDGTTDWTLTGNRFFQTGTRTQSSAAAHSAIEVASAVGNNHHTITDNVIGYASAAGTGTYSLVGAGSGSKFLAIRFSAAGSTTASSVQGNTITAIALSGVVGGTGTSAAFAGIVVNSGAVTIGDVLGNTIGSASAPGAISIATANGSASEVYGIYFFPSLAATISNNLVAGVAVANSGAGSVIFYGLRAATSPTVVNSLANNVVGAAAAPVTVSAASTSSRILGIVSSSGAANLTGNDVGYLSLDSGNPGTGATATESTIGLWVNTTSTLGNSVARNTVHHLSNSHPSAAVSVTGVHYNGSTTGTHVVNRNFVHSLTVASTSATAAIHGLFVQAGATTYANNMVALGAGLTATSPQLNGINETATGTDNFYFNSVYIGGAGVAAGSSASFAFQSSIVTVTRNVRDNIFWNARSNGAATAKHYAVRVGGTAPNPAGLTSNHNLLRASGSGGLTGLFNGIDRATLADWQTATGQDAASASDDPRFLAPTSTTPDLHIDPAVNTPVEASGFAIGAVTDDYDGQLRSGLTPTDIGADAGNFLSGESTPPTILFTPLLQTTSSSNRTLAVTVSDSSGVPTSGAGLPRIYYRKLPTGAFAGQACTHTSGAAYDCLLDYSLLPGGSVATGDVVQYYVAAQDNVGNVTANPLAGAGGFSTNPPAAATPPSVPASYAIALPLSGGASVGTGGTYASLTNPGGLFEAIAANVLTGDLTVDVVSDLAGETGTVALTPWIEEGAGGYSLTIRPAGSPRTVSGDSSSAGAVRALLRLQGADRVTFDGSTSNGSDRSLTVVNNDASATSAVFFVGAGSDGASSNRFQNLVVVGSGSSQTLYGIAFGGAALDTPGADNDGNRVENCDFRRAQVGIASLGASAGNPNSGTVLTGNFLAHTGIDRLGRGGMLLGFESGIEISSNEIGGIDSTGTSDVFGLSLGALTNWSNATTVGGSEVTNATVTRNRIGTVQQTNGRSAAGILVAPTTSGTTLLANNFVSGVLSNGTAGEFGAGIFLIDSGSDSTTRIYANSIALTGSSTGSDQGHFAIAIGGSNPTVDLADDIFFDDQTTGASNPGYAVGLAYASFSNLSSNRNALYVPPAGTFRVGRTGSLAPAGGTDHLTLAAWQSATGKDAASIAADPLFVSATDLHLTDLSPVRDSGVTLAAVASDIDGDPRPAATPDLGADELVQADLTISKSDGLSNVAPGGSVTYTIVASNLGAHAALGARVVDTFAAVLTCSTTCVASGGGSCSAGPSTTNIDDIVQLPVGASVTYTAVCTVSGSASGTLSNTATVSPPAGVSDPNPGDNAATDVDTLIVAPSADVSITKTDGAATEIPGTPVTYTIIATNAGPSAAPTVTVTDTFAATLSGCSTTCVAAGGAACVAGPILGNLSTNANLPVGGSATYTATCTISLAATGTLVNTATATVGGGVGDPVLANNSATDTDTLLSLTIFVDGFESGGTGSWSASVPLTFEAYAHLATTAGEVEARYDFAGVPANETLPATAMAYGMDGSGKPLFAVELRRTALGEPLEMALAILGGGRSRWIPVGEVTQQLRLEWVAAGPSHGGHLALHLDGRLALWVEGDVGTEAPAGLELLRHRALR